MHSLKNKDFTQLIRKTLLHKEKGLPFVLYQKPNEKLVKAIFSNSSDLAYTTDFLESGFVFAPFDVSKKAILFSNTTTENVDYEIEDKLLTKKTVLLEDGKEFHLKLVTKAIRKIKSGDLKKVVVSRKIVVPTEKDEFQLFQELLNTYSNAFKYLWYHPKVGMWLGATPETLLKSTKDIITTTSLAGTLSVNENDPPNWSTKEIEEQQIVTDYILDALSNKLTNLKTTKAIAVKAGKLWHLKSVITGNIKANNKLATIISALHPTPAVCGIPKEVAQNFLNDNEGYNRTFYTGFLGELNLGEAKHTHLCVNLRCMKLGTKEVTIYMGGGITGESNAELEWQETQHKSKTMLSLL